MGRPSRSAAGLFVLFAVLAAAAGVFGTGQGWPDALVAAGMGVLALHSAIKVARQALGELKPATA